MGQNFKASSSFEKRGMGGHKMRKKGREVHPGKEGLGGDNIHLRTPQGALLFAVETGEGKSLKGYL